MGLDDKIANAAEHAKGTAKEAAGKATGDDRLETEGQIDQAKADAKKVGEDVKDAFKD
ncbi:MAG TPA: CsbD family protein [Cellulomonas sp.]